MKLPSFSEVLQRLTPPAAETMNRRQRSLAYASTVAQHTAAELKHDQAGEMAAALSYRTIFSLVPLVVLGLVLFRAFGAMQGVGDEVQAWAFRTLGLTSLELSANAEAASPSVAPPGAEAPPAATDATPHTEGAQVRQSRRENVAWIISEITRKASGVNLGSVGSIGLLLLIWAAIALLATIEHSFNRIYNCSEGRSWYRRVTTYWAVITLGPLLLSVSFYFTDRVGDWMAAVSKGPHGPQGLVAFAAAMVELATRFTALLAMWLLLFLLYVLVPNTRVRLRSAAVGSLVAAAAWEISKALFRLYVRKALSYSALYGSLGLLPLFLFWVYLGWMIVLFGLELSFTLQMMKSRQFKHAVARANQDLFYDPRCLIPMMAMIGRAFGRGETVGDTDIARELEVPLRAVSLMAQRLESAGLIHRVNPSDDRDPGYALAVPADTVPLGRLLELSASMASGGINRLKGPAAGWMSRLTQAQRDVAGEATLAKLLETERPAPAGGLGPGGEGVGSDPLSLGKRVGVKGHTG